MRTLSQSLSQSKSGMPFNQRFDSMLRVSVNSIHQYVKSSELELQRARRSRRPAVPPWKAATSLYLQRLRYVHVLVINASHSRAIIKSLLLDVSMYIHRKKLPRRTKRKKLHCRKFKCVRLLLEHACTFPESIFT